jgi:hypothetical protein
MDLFGAYVDKLEALAQRLVRQSPSLGSADRAALAAALNGQPGKELRRVVPIAQLRRHGAFFTGSKLAAKAVQSTLSRLSTSSMIADFSCGAGDLLVACSAYLPLESSLSQTVVEWGKRLIGRDLQPEFVRAAKARLVLAAIQRGVLPRDGKLFEHADSFPDIRIGCGRADAPSLRACSHIVINPPFTMVEAPVDCDWAGGSVNGAALFVETCLRHAKVGARLVAILPEVLRCGTRYQRWRMLIEKLARITRIDPVGQFDAWTDVDIFIMEAEVRSEGRPGVQAADWGYADFTPKTRLVGDYFNVTVGPVVPFRVTNRGPWTPYFQPHALPGWATVKRAPKKIRYSGKSLVTPLVVVRRTSRLGDKKRAIGTIIVGESPAIENHLLVLRPKDGKLDTCKQLLKTLRRPETDAWLDRRMRCRHLTIAAVRDLPWLSEVK